MTRSPTTRERPSYHRAAQPGPFSDVAEGRHWPRDGVTAGRPGARLPVRLQSGETPPQFVVFSWDGAANLSTGLFPRFRSLANELGGSMTFFLSGLYALPEDRRMMYAPPRHPVGSSTIGFLSTQEVLDTMSEVRLAWLDGHEIGTHFNGHFCGADGVGLWSPEDWAIEIGARMSGSGGREIRRRRRSDPNGVSLVAGS